MADDTVAEKDATRTPESLSCVDKTEKRPLSQLRTNDRSESDATETALDRDSPVRKLYLSFDTELPSPDYGVVPREKLPLCPSLKPYESPLTWSSARKATGLALACISTFLTAYSAGSYSPPSRLIAADIHATHVEVLVGIVTFCMGFAVAPMALAPVSEIWGRYPVFFGAGIMFVVFQALCSVMPNLAGMLVARFFVGCGGSVFSSVMAGVLADLWKKEERNTPMALFSGAVLAGTGAGPLISTVFVNGIDDDTLAWRWCFWHQTIMGTLLVAAIIIFFRESRASVLLTRKAKTLNQWYAELERAGIYGVRFPNAELLDQLSASSPSPVPGSESNTQSGGVDQLTRIRWVVEEDEKRASLGTLIATSVKRPFFLLFTEPVVFWFSLWAAFSWGILFLSFAIVPYLYGTNLGKASRVYAAMIAASIVATAVGIAQDRLLQHPQWRQRENAAYRDSRFWAFMRKHFPAEAPEARLYFACITAMFLPLGLLGGFLSDQSQAGVSEAVGLGFATWGIYSVYLATFNYLADSYHIYASSALAAQGFARNVTGGAFPVITGYMFRRLGIKGAGGLLGGVATALTLTPFVLVFFGKKIRAKSKVMKVSSRPEPRELIAGALLTILVPAALNIDIASENRPYMATGVVFRSLLVSALCPLIIPAWKVSAYSWNVCHGLYS